MDSRQLKIDELNQKLSKLRDEKEALIVELENWAEKRDALNEQIRTARVEIGELRNQRDELNSSVQDLKKLRAEPRGRARERIEEIKRLQTEISNIVTKRKPSGNPRVLQEEFDDVEWQIQTSSLTLEDEKELVEKARMLETQLKIHKKIQQLKRRIAELRTQLKDLDSESGEHHEDLQKKAAQSQAIHEKLQKRIIVVKKLKEQADSKHATFVQTRNKIKPVQEEIRRTLDELNKLRAELRVEEDAKRKENEDELRGELEQRALEKLRKGAKLSWEEFQILAEKGISTQS